MGWRGGRVLEPGIGTGLFPALMPEVYRDTAYVTGVELDPITARIVRLLQPKARIITGDFARADLTPVYDLAIGNPPFSDRSVRSDRQYRALGLRLHDYFIARSIDLLKPGAFAAFVTSSGTMDKADITAREHIAKSADLIAAIRLPEGSFRRDAGTDVVVDILFFRKRKAGEPEGDQIWLDVDEVRPATDDEGAIRVNRWFARHPDFVLGDHALTSSLCLSLSAYRKWGQFRDLIDGNVFSANAGLKLQAAANYAWHVMEERVLFQKRHDATCLSNET